MNFITFKFSIRDNKISRFDLTVIYETFSRTFFERKNIGIRFGVPLRILFPTAMSSPNFQPGVISCSRLLFKSEDS